MQNENIALQAKVFLYHLNNSNTENSIRKDECWTLMQVSENTKKEIERDYNPTVMTRVDPEIMQAFSISVLENVGTQPRLKLMRPSIDHIPGSDYLIAFPSTRITR
ncbi:hypothetical protein [Pedobacter kyonggii]|uniref:Uncharacterized protein n=1 Tax=Pedobacter kyonggii TaxID=1926871 RepID=A0A4Q9H310_9SPHI|nr:hypothetical protein [Pedobacter kyonggii]TBO35929.1 hypothetical protein EYS08_25470 [Pedobacter kyonggii]